MMQSIRQSSTGEKMQRWSISEPRLLPVALKLSRNKSNQLESFSTSARMIFKIKILKFCERATMIAPWRTNFGRRPEIRIRS